MANLDDLIEALEASEGSRELSDMCLLATGWTYTPKHISMAWESPGGHWKGFLDRPDPSQNLQDVIDWMTPKGWGTDTKGTHQYNDGRWMWGLWRFHDLVSVCSVCNKIKPSVVYCIAALKALEEPL